MPKIYDNIHEYLTKGLNETLEVSQRTDFCVGYIDCVLAEHYGFTEEELDFIINYDIKYRMGKALNEEEEDE